MDSAFDRLEKKIDAFEVRVRTVEQAELGCQPLLTSRIVSAETRLNNHESDIRLLQTAITEVKQAIKIVTWVGTTVGGLIIAWIIGQMMGLIK